MSEATNHTEQRAMKNENNAIISATILWSESSEEYNNMTFTGGTRIVVGALNTILAGIRNDCQVGGTYDKTSIVFTLASGRTWEARYDVKADGTDADVLTHFEDMARYAASEAGADLRGSMRELYANAGKVATDTAAALAA